MNYYNEFDEQAAQWLRNLIDAGLIPAGDVDTRSIEDVRPDELRGYTQHHFFCGIGGWPLALQLAGWPTSRPIWTGSCPCQPFSAAGKGAGFDDQRHLWPAWFHLIRECKPAVIVGEQVASPDALKWLDLVSVDLESQDYAVGAADLCSAGVGGAHIRQRLYWMAHAASDDKHNRGRQSGSSGPMPDRGRGAVGERLAHAIEGQRGRRPNDGPLQQHGQARGRQQVAGDAERGGESGRLGIANNTGPQPGQSAAATAGHRGSAESAGADCGVGDAERDGLRVSGRPAANMPDQSGDGTIWVKCSDGVSRPASAEPGAFPLVTGLSRELVRGQPVLAAMARGASRNRVARLRGYGNAIDPRVAAEFLMAAMEVTS